MRRRVFRTHYILAIGGRFFLLLLLCFPLFMLYLLVRDFYSLDMLTIIVSIPFIAGFSFLCMWVSKYLWRQCWGKIKLKSDYMVWSCLFCKPVKIPYNEIKYVSVRSFLQGNALKNVDLYNTGFLHIIISTGEIPSTQLDKVKSKPGLIKFNFSVKLGMELIARMPEKFTYIIKKHIVKRKKARKG